MNRLFSLAASRSRSSVRRTRRSLRLESLEARQMFSTGPLDVSPAWFAASTGGNWASSRSPRNASGYTLTST